MVSHIIDVENDIIRMTRQERHDLLLKLEAAVDQHLLNNTTTQEEAWDMYFGLLHECDESNFIEDRPRILAKIDTKKYHPFRSSNPRIVFLARMRAIGMGLIGNN